MTWFYIALAASFALGISIGMSLGLKKGRDEAIQTQKQLEATRLWAESLEKFMGGSNVQH